MANTMAAKFEELRRAWFVLVRTLGKLLIDLAAEHLDK